MTAFYVNLPSTADILDGTTQGPVPNSTGTVHGSGSYSPGASPYDSSSKGSKPGVSHTHSNPTSSAKTAAHSGQWNTSNSYPTSWNAPIANQGVLPADLGMDGDIALKELPPDPNRPKGWKLDATKKSRIYKRYAWTLKGAKEAHIKYNISWNEAKMRRRAFHRGVGCFICTVAIILGIVIGLEVDKGKKARKLAEHLAKFPPITSTPVWLTHWDNFEHFPEYCITPKHAAYVEIRCHGMNVIPDFEHVRGTIMIAYMSNNTWPTIGNNLFSKMPNLTHLDLTKSKISKIESDAFKYLNKLHTLMLSQNDLGRMSGLFLSANLKALKKLYLVQCKILKLSKDAFKNVASIEKLYLSSNLLEEIHKDTFQVLQNLTEIWLDENSLQTIDSSLFESTINLKIVHLEGNNIKEIKNGTFSTLNPFSNGNGWLSLVNNDIHAIDSNAFSAFASLNTLKLDGNDQLNCSSIDALPEVISLSGTPKSCNEDTMSVTCQLLNCSAKNRSCRATSIGLWCVCHRGYEGDNCDTDINECEVHSPCIQGSVCLNTEGSYRCVYPKDSKAADQEDGNSSVMVLIIVPILVIAFAFVLIVYFRNQTSPDDNTDKVMNEEPYTHGRKSTSCRRKKHTSSTKVLKANRLASKRARGSRRKLVGLKSR